MACFDMLLHNKDMASVIAAAPKLVPHLRASTTLSLSAYKGLPLILEADNVLSLGIWTVHCYQVGAIWTAGMLVTREAGRGGGHCPSECIR